MEVSKVIGVDGCKGGWVGVSLAASVLEIRLSSSLEDLLEIFGPFELLLIDMPIGLPETVQEAQMRPEALARKLLPNKASSVFNVPCRQAVYAPDYAEANRCNREVLGKGLSKQSYYISTKIRELDQLLCRTADSLRSKVWESHPELCFARLQPNGQPILEKKSIPEGMAKRFNILKMHEPAIADAAEREIRMDRRLHSIKADVLDALCLAVTARLGMKAGFTCIPEKVIYDRNGLPMQMIYVDAGKNKSLP